MSDPLPGFRDFYPEDFAVRSHIFNVWRQTARRFGFLEYDAPVLEPLELFTRKSGEEIVGQLFAFTDKGGREVALRPEMTPTLARLVGAKAKSIKKPVKYFSIGENFRYEKPQKGRTRSFFQFNADVLGLPGVGADGELLALLIEALAALGLTADMFQVRLSDRDLWLLFLESMGVGPKDAGAVLGVIDKMERVPRETSLSRLQAFLGDRAEAFLAQVDELTQLRGLDDVREFMLLNIADETVKQRVNVRLGEWAELLDILRSMGLDAYTHIDLGIVRGLAYYTGFVFEAFEASGENRALAGGGRYDKLVAKLGYPDFPACGFAVGDVTLTNLLQERGLSPQYTSRPDVYVVIGGDDERPVALAGVAELRRAGVGVEYALQRQGFGKQFKVAGQMGARLALIYGAEELATRSVKVKDLSSGNEAQLRMEDFVPAVIEILAEGI